MIDIGRICLEMGRFFSILIISKQYRCVDLISCFEVCKYLWLEERMIALKRLLAFWIDYFIILILLAVLVGGKLMWENPILFWSKVAIIIYLYFCFNDILFNGLSIGKKTVQMQVKLKTKNIYVFAITHSLLKEICAFL